MFTANAHPDFAIGLHLSHLLAAEELRFVFQTFFFFLVTRIRNCSKLRNQQNAQNPRMLQKVDYKQVYNDSTQSEN